MHDDNGETIAATLQARLLSDLCHGKYEFQMGVSHVSIHAAARFPLRCLRTTHPDFQGIGRLRGLGGKRVTSRSIRSDKCATPTAGKLAARGI